MSMQGQTPVGGSEVPLIAIGDVAVSQHWVSTPNGAFPLQRTSWTVADRTFVTRELPQWALVMTIVGFLFICAFSLFFLLAKEDRVQGFVEVTIHGDGRSHTTQIPVTALGTSAFVHQQVNYVRGLVTALG